MRRKDARVGSDVVPDIRNDAFRDLVSRRMAAPQKPSRSPPARLAVGELDALVEREAEIADGYHDRGPGDEGGGEGGDGVAPAGPQGVQGGAEPYEQGEQGEVARVPIQPDDIGGEVVVQREREDEESSARSHQGQDEAVAPGEKHGDRGDGDHSKTEEPEAVHERDEGAERPAAAWIIDPLQREAGACRCGEEAGDGAAADGEQEGRRQWARGGERCPPPPSGHGLPVRAEPSGLEDDP